MPLILSISCKKMLQKSEIKSPMSSHSTKITILGCGFSGMITALALANVGHEVIIIEQKDPSSNQFFHDVRTTALTDHSKLFLEKIGLWNEVSEIAGPIIDIYVVDNKSPNILHFGQANLAPGQIMGYIVRNDDLKKKLYSITSSHPKIHIIDKTSYQVVENRDKCSIKIDAYANSVHSDLVIVCDGPNSSTRKHYFSSSIDKKYDQFALTFLVKHEKSHDGTAVEHFMNSGPFAILPLKNKYHSSVVWTIELELAKTILNLPNDEFLYLVEHNFGPFLGEVEIISEVASYPLRAYLTSKYYNKNIALIADTAHIIHPLAGQGLNQGIKDIESLKENLTKYGLNQKALSNYENERKHDNNNMLEITDTINVIFSNNSKILHHARQTAFKAINKIDPFKKLLIEYAMGKRK